MTVLDRIECTVLSSIGLHVLRIAYTPRMIRSKSKHCTPYESRPTGQSRSRSRSWTSQMTRMERAHG